MVNLWLGSLEACRRLEGWSLEGMEAWKLEERKPLEKAVGEVLVTRRLIYDS